MSKNSRTLIVAEAGVNHNGDTHLAKNLVEIAASAGADVVKFQTFSANRLVTQRARKADYQVKKTEQDESQYNMLRRLELTISMHEELIAYCKQCGINFCSTGFDEQSIDFLVGLGIDFIKVPSGEITNLPYLRHVGAINKPVILSTGMATLGEVESALEVFEMAGMCRNRIIVLHCNTEYPTPMADVNLRAMKSIADALGVAVGYSDHTLGIEVPIAAVAMGACLIEKHFTLDRSLPGPDHKASLEPSELKAMVSSIRNIEQAMGDGIKRPTSSEIKNRSVVRKSLVAARDINTGELFSPENITTKRPATGISPMRWDEIIGTKAKRNFLINEIITL